MGRFSGRDTPKGRVILPPDPLTQGDRLRHEFSALARAKAGECSGFDDLARTRHGTAHAEMTYRDGRWVFAKVWCEPTSAITADELEAILAGPLEAPSEEPEEAIGVTS